VNGIQIRVAERADAASIAEFNYRLAQETEAKLLDDAKLLAGVTALIENPTHGTYYVAEFDSKIVAQLLITYEWSDWRNGLFWWIQSVYVASDYRRNGIFKALYSHVRNLAETSDEVCGLRLHVEADNDVAQATYSSLGMSPNSYRLMELEF